MTGNLFHLWCLLFSCFSFLLFLFHFSFPSPALSYFFTIFFGTARLPRFLLLLVTFLLAVVAILASFSSLSLTITLPSYSSCPMLSISLSSSFLAALSLLLRYSFIVFIIIVLLRPFSLVLLILFLSFSFFHPSVYFFRLLLSFRVVMSLF